MTPVGGLSLSPRSRASGGTSLNGCTSCHTGRTPARATSAGRTAHLSGIGDPGGSLTEGSYHPSPDCRPRGQAAETSPAVGFNGVAVHAAVASSVGRQVSAMGEPGRAARVRPLRRRGQLPDQRDRRGCRERSLSGEIGTSSCGYPVSVPRSREDLAERRTRSGERRPGSHRLGADKRATRGFATQRRPMWRVATRPEVAPWGP